MGDMHTSVTKACGDYFRKFRRQVHVTPKTFLSFLEVYKQLYETKVGITTELAASISSGLQKLDEAKDDILQMKARPLRGPAEPIEGLVHGSTTTQKQKESSS